MIVGKVRHTFTHVDIKSVVEDLVVLACLDLCKGALHRHGSTVFAQVRFGLFTQDVGVHADRSTFRIHATARQADVCARFLRWFLDGVGYYLGPRSGAVPRFNTGGRVGDSMVNFYWKLLVVRASLTLVWIMWAGVCVARRSDCLHRNEALTLEDLEEFFSSCRPARLGSPRLLYRPRCAGVGR